MGDLQEPIPDGAVSLPVIDLSHGRDELSRAILDAGKNIGFFQASPNILSWFNLVSWLIFFPDTYVSGSIKRENK
jgi:hypothetical protein